MVPRSWGTDQVTTPEGKIKAKLRKALDANFPNHYRFMPVQSGYGSKTLDFLLCIDGMFVAIETKAPGNVATPLQESCMKDIHKAGGLVQVVDSDDTIARCMAFIHLALKFKRFQHGPDFRKDALGPDFPA